MQQDHTGPLSDLLFQRATTSIGEPRPFADPQDIASVRFSVTGPRLTTQEHQPAVGE